MDVAKCNATDADLEDRLLAWARELSGAVSSVAELTAQPWAQQCELGYGHTLREICQPPLTWHGTAERAIRFQDTLAALIGETESIVFTGSGRSLIAGECLAEVVRNALGIPAKSVPGGDLVVCGCRTQVVAKLGARDSTIPEDAHIVVCPAARVISVDTTGGGRLFQRGVSLPVARRQNLGEAMCFGGACGALSTLPPGGTASQPTRGRAVAFLNAQQLETEVLN
jgi:sugar/nucleoside kinase (ribokinase family)